LIISLLLLFLSILLMFFAKYLFYENPKHLAYFVTAFIAILFLLRLLHSMVRKMQIALGRAEGIIKVLRDSRDRYALAVSGIDDGIWDWDIKSGEIIFSSGWKKMLGYRADEDIDAMRFWNGIVHKDDVKMLNNAIQYHFDGRTKHYIAEYRVKSRNGLYKWLMDRGTVTRDEKGRPLRMVVSSRDITNRKNAEFALKSRTDELRIANKQIKKEIGNTRKFKQAVDSSTDSVMMLDTDGSIEYVNPSLERATGYDFSELRGKIFTTLYQEKTKAELLQKIKEAFLRGRAYRSEDVVVSKKDGGWYTQEFSLYPIRKDGRIIHFVVIGQDITKRKEVDTAKSEFVSLASHQLRTPLSAIRWYSEMLLDGVGGELNKQQKKYLQEVYNANIRMIELVGTLLDVSRLDLGKFPINKKMTNVSYVVETIIKELQPIIEKKNLKVTKKFAEKIEDMCIDPKMLRMVFHNLISNALKYTPENGEISIVLKQESGKLFVEVADTGCGIPKEQQSKIFTKLFRADNAREIDSSGTGLGLYIVRVIVEKMKGSIRFSSEENKGSTFYVIIPMQDKKECVAKN